MHTDNKVVALLVRLGDHYLIVRKNKHWRLPEVPLLEGQNETSRAAVYRFATAYGLEGVIGAVEFFGIPFDGVVGKEISFTRVELNCQEPPQIPCAPDSVWVTEEWLCNHRADLHPAVVVAFSFLARQDLVYKLSHRTS